MSQTITAIYEDGVFKPLQKVNIKPHQKAELIIFPEEARKLVKAQKKALSKLRGICHSGLPDIGSNHDKYLYQKDKI